MLDSYTNDQGQKIIQIKKHNTELIYHITMINDTDYSVKIMLNNLILLEFKDLEITDTTFVREFKKSNHKYYYSSNELIYKKIHRPTKFLRTIKLSKVIDNKIMTLDIETRKVNNVLTPYALSYYDGLKLYSFYLSDYNSPVLALARRNA